MWANLLTQIYNLRWIVLIYTALGIAGSLLITFVARRFDWNKKKIRAFAFLYTLSDNRLTAYAFSLGRMIYVIYLSVFCSSLGLESLAVLVLLTLVCCIIAKDFKGLPGQLLTYICLFALLLLESMFESYYTDVEAFWLIKAMVVFLGTFSSLYAVYHQVTVHERLVLLSFGETESAKAMDVPLNINDFKFLFGKDDSGEGVSIVDVQKKA